MLEIDIDTTMFFTCWTPFHKVLICISYLFPENKFWRFLLRQYELWTLSYFKGLRVYGDRQQISFLKIKVFSMEMFCPCAGILYIYLNLCRYLVYLLEPVQVSCIFTCPSAGILYLFLKCLFGLFLLSVCLSRCFTTSDMYSGSPSQ